MPEFPLEFPITPRLVQVKEWRDFFLMRCITFAFNLPSCVKLKEPYYLDSPAEFLSFESLAKKTFESLAKKNVSISGKVRQLRQNHAG